MKARTIGYWMTTAIAFLVFLGSGIGNLAGVEHIAHDMTRLGYPRYFMIVLGAWKVLGAIAIVLPRFPRLKEWAYAGMLFDLTGAAVSRAASGDDAGEVVAPLVISALVVASWALRPEARVLTTPRATQPAR